MTAVIGGATVALVETRGKSMHLEAFASRLDMVCQVINNGAIGGGVGGFGGDAHIAALAAVEAQCAETRRLIVEHRIADAERGRSSSEDGES